MTTAPDTANTRDDLRSRAVAHLQGTGTRAQARADASAALGVLYELASSPATAPDALALLHELQVYQVELDLQDEELRRSRIELEKSLDRQVQLYEYAPAACLTVEDDGTLRELNRTGATLLGFDGEFLRGRSLESLLMPVGVSALRAMLGRIAAGAPAGCGELAVRSAPDGETRVVHASACRDPAGGGFLIVMIGQG